MPSISNLIGVRRTGPRFTADLRSRSDRNGANQWTPIPREAHEKSKSGANGSRFRLPRGTSSIRSSARGSLRVPRMMVRGRRSRSFGMACCALGVVLGAGPCPHDRAYIRARSGLRLCAGGRGGADTNACRSRSGLRHGGCATRREGDGDEEAEGRGFHGGFRCWLDFVTAGQSGCPRVGACFLTGKPRLCGPGRLRQSDGDRS